MTPEKILSVLSKIGEAYWKPGNQTAHVVSAIVFKKDIVAIGVSKKKTHPLQARYGKNKHSIYLHAEIDAIQKSARKFDLTKCEIYVCRVRKWKVSGNKHEFGWGLAKPCIGCADAIEAFGIRRVYYTCDSREMSKYEII